MNQEKAEYLRSGFVNGVSKLEQQAKGAWGKMNAQQMVEHMSYSFRLASGRHPEAPSLTPEQTEKSYKFMMSEKPFKENTPNKLLPDDPEPLKNVDMAAAINELRNEIEYFFKVYESTPELRTINPFFGNLNFEEQVQLLEKHARHHARQFGV